MSNRRKILSKGNMNEIPKLSYLVIVESEIWKEYFNKQNLRVFDILSTLIREDRVAICGYTFVRILQEVRERDSFEKILKGLLTLPYIEIEKKDWIEASKLLFKFKDLNFELALLCVLSLNKNLKILTKNKEVKKIKSVKLYEDEKE